MLRSSKKPSIIDVAKSRYIVCSHILDILGMARLVAASCFRVATDHLVSCNTDLWLIPLFCTNVIPLISISFVGNNCSSQGQEPFGNGAHGWKLLWSLLNQYSKQACKETLRVLLERNMS